MRRRELIKSVLGSFFSIPLIPFLPRKEAASEVHINEAGDGWYHIVSFYDPESGNFKYFVNGEEVSKLELPNFSIQVERPKSGTKEVIQLDEAGKVKGVKFDGPTGITEVGPKSFTDPLKNGHSMSMWFHLPKNPGQA